MDDNSMVKIMQALDLDYSKAILSTLQFGQSIEVLNKQLADMKSGALQSAKDINTVFASQLGQNAGNKTLADQYGNAFKTARQESEKMSQSIKASTFEQLKAQAASVQQRTATKKLNEDYSTQAGLIREQLDTLQKKLQAEGKLSSEEVKQTQNLQEQLKILKAQTSSDISDQITKNPSISLSEEWNRRSSWFLSGTLFYGIVNGAKEAYESIKDVEMGMTEIARVMEDSNFEFNKYRDDLIQLGVTYGQTFENVQDVALRWAQAGYNANDSLELTKTSLLALNTAELDAQNATESMIGIMAQWGLQAGDLSLVMDKVNKVADDYSVTSQDLVDGLLRSSSAAKIMNLSLDETIGLLTVMKEASGRTGQEVGNALNSILSYVQRPKSIEVLEANGIQVFANEAKTQFRNVLDIFKDIASKWDTLSGTIQEGFVQAADDAGLFNEELATALGAQEEWNDLQQRDISQAAAGVYRRNYFIGMIERLSNVQGVLNDMMDAEGYSMSENARTMDTLEKKNQSLKASLEGLAVAAGDAGLAGTFKTLATAGTDVFNTINKLPEPMKNFTMATLDTFIAVKTLQVATKLFGINIPGVSQMITSLTSGTLSLAAAFKAAGTGITTFITANLPLLAISAAVGAIVAITNAVKEHNEEKEKAIETSKQNIQNYEKEINGLSELAIEYSTLKEKERNLTATADEKKRLFEIQNELVETYGVSVTGINEEGKAYSDSTTLIKERIEALEKLRDLEQEKVTSNVLDTDNEVVASLEENLAKREEILKKIKEKDKEINEAMSTLESGGSMTHTVYGAHGQAVSTVINASTEQGIEELKDYIGDLNGEKSDLIQALDDINSDIEDKTKDRKQLLMNDAVDIVQQLSDSGIEITDETRAFATEMAKALSEAPESIFELKDKLKNAIKEFSSSNFNEWVDKYNEALAKNDTKGIDEASEAINKLVHNFTDGIPSLNNFALAMEGMYPTAEQLANFTENAADKTETLDEIMTKTAATVRETMSSLKVLNQAIYDVRHGQSLSIDTILELNESYGLSLDAVKKTTNGYTVESSVLEDLRKAKIQTSIDSINAEKETTQKTVDAAKTRLESYQLEIEQIKNLANAKVTLARAANAEAMEKSSFGGYDPLGMSEYMTSNTRANLYKKYYNEAYSDIDSNVAKYQSAVEELESLDKRASILTSMLNDRSYGVTVPKSSSGSSKSSKAKTEKYENKPLEEAIKLLEHRKRMSEETQNSIQAEITELNRINKLYVKTEEERMDMAERIYSAEKKLMDKRLQDSVNWINEKKELNELSVEDEISAWERVLKNQSNNMDAVKEATTNLYKLRTQLNEEANQEIENSIEHLANLGVYTVQQQIDKYKELYSVKAESIEDEMKRTEKLFNLYKEALSEEQEKIKTAYDERLKKIDEEAEKKKNAQQEVIDGIEKELDLIDKREQEYSHENQMADLQEQLEYWQVRTSEEARKKVIEIQKQMDEEEHKRSVELEKQGLEDKKSAAEDKIDTIEDAAKEEREKLEKSYSLIEKAFDEHSVDMIALVGAMSEEMYNKFRENYLDRIIEDLSSGNYESAGKIADSIDDYVKDSSSKAQSKSKNYQIYQLASTILALKKQYEYGNDKSAAERALSYYNELSKLSSTVANKLHELDYERAKEYVSRLPKAHTGGKTLSYGAVYMKPGELIFPPDLSVSIENLVNTLKMKPVQISNPSSTLYDNKRETKIDKLVNIEKNYMGDDTDIEVFSREIGRLITRSF